MTSPLKISIKNIDLTLSPAQQAFLDHMQATLAPAMEMLSKVYRDSYMATLIDGIPRGVEYEITDDMVITYRIIELPYEPEEDAIYGRSVIQDFISKN